MAAILLSLTYLTLYNQSGFDRSDGSRLREWLENSDRCMFTGGWQVDKIL